MAYNLKEKEIIAIDPGPTQSAYILYDGKKICDKGIEDNETMLEYLHNYNKYPQYAPYLIIEKIASYGMPVGESIFETVFWTGRFAEAYGGEAERIPRKDIKMHLCNATRAKDSNIRQALIDRFGKPGTKKNPGLTYGLKKDMWAAFALAVTYWDTHENLP